MHRNIPAGILATIVLFASTGADAEITADNYAAAEKWVVPRGTTTNPYVKNLLPIPRWIGDGCTENPRDANHQFA